MCCPRTKRHRRTRSSSERRCGTRSAATTAGTTRAICASTGSSSAKASASSCARTIGIVSAAATASTASTRGKPYSVYFNVNTRAGEAVIDGKKITDAAQAKKYVDDGYEAFINDSYWLLAPFKIFDPGVSLTDGGEDKGPKGEPCDVIKLTFAGVGLTPKDVYWLYVDKKTHLVDEWKFVLNGESKPPSAFAWSDWKKVGSIRAGVDAPGHGQGERDPLRQPQGVYGRG